MKVHLEVSIQFFLFYFITYTFIIDRMKGIAHAIVNGRYAAPVKLIAGFGNHFSNFLLSKKVLPRFPHKPDFYVL